MSEVAIRDAFRETGVAFLGELASAARGETLYALLFEISSQSSGAWAVGATEESLGREVERMNGQRMRSDKTRRAEPLEDLCRWDAPGDTPVWYWSSESSHAELNRLLNACFEGDSPEEHAVVMQLALDGFRAVSGTEVFQRLRPRPLLGVSCVERDFDSFIDLNAQVNPAEQMERLRKELAACSIASVALRAGG